MLGSLVTFILAFIFTRSLTLSGAIVLGEVMVKTVLYYLHERGWTRSTFGLENVSKAG